MKSLFALTFSCVVLLASTGFGQEKEEGFVPLFNGKDLQGWTSAHSTGEGDWGPFSYDSQEKAIHVYAGQEPNSKQKSDCLYSNKEYSHFILKLEYKWLESRFAPRPDYDRDAGLLFHVHGDLKKVWPWCLEMQIGESPGDKPDAKGSKGRFHSGDLFVLRKDLRTATPVRDKKWFDPEGEVKVGRSVRTPLGVEKPKGEWNEIELHVHGSEKATFILNGQTVLETKHFHFKDKEGNTSTLHKGRIGVQAEWAELMYRNMRIKELSPKMDKKSEQEMKMKMDTSSGSGSKESEPAGSGSK